MKKLLSIYFWIATSSLTAVLYLAMVLVTVFTFPFEKRRYFAHAQCYWWSDAIVGLNPFWKLHVKGLRHIDKHRAYIIAANHQSLADIIILYKIRIHFKWVAKDSLFRIPFLGWCMSQAKHIRLRRGSMSSVKQVYREAADWLRKGVSVTFFPEGTRSETHDMGEFQNGAFKLAIKEKVPILPVRLTGMRNAIPKKSWVFASKAEGTINVLPPIDTTAYKPGDFEKLKTKVFTQLQSAA